MNENARETSKYWRTEGFDDLELLSATYITHAFDRHIHEGFALGVVLRGAEQFYYRGSIHIARAGQLVAVNPGEIHTGEAHTPVGWTYRMMYPGVVLMRQIAREMFGKIWNFPSFPYAVIDDPTLAAQLQQAHLVLEHSPLLIERQTALRDVLASFILRHGEDQPTLYLHHHEQRPVQIARDYLEAHYAENVSLDDLALHAQLSPFHLLRLFRSQMGLPPHTYLTHVRVSRAKALLAMGMPVANVAQMVGFSDQSHLTRRFKRIVGIPPGYYAQQVS